jgi:type II secretory pathway component PulF
MKPAALLNAILFLVGGLITWALIVWLPHRELERVSGYLGRPENLPPLSKRVYEMQQAIFSARWLILIFFAVACVAYYFFYNWASAKRRYRMLLHNIIIFLIFIALYGLLIYNMVGVRVALRGIVG